MFRGFVGAFLGKLAAAFFIAACLSLGFGPDKWAELILGKPFATAAMRIGFAVLGACVLLIIFGPSIASGFRRLINSSRSDFTGTPIGIKGFHWGETGAEPYRMGRPRVIAKNVSGHEIDLVDIAFVSPRTGKRLSTVVSTSTGQQILPSDAETIPLDAEFQIEGTLPQHTQPVDVSSAQWMYLPEEILRDWSDLYVHIETTSKKYDVRLSSQIKIAMDSYFQIQTHLAGPPRPPGITRKAN